MRTISHLVENSSLCGPLPTPAKQPCAPVEVAKENSPRGAKKGHTRKIVRAIDHCPMNKDCGHRIKNCQRWKSMPSSEYALTSIRCLLN
jgi:hypothetical protein